MLRCFAHREEGDILEWNHRLGSSNRLYLESRDTNVSFLFFRQVTTANQGNYTCIRRVGRFQVAVEAATVTVLLEEPPTVCLCNAIFPLMHYFAVSITCNIQPSRTSEGPQWRVNGQPVTHDATHEYELYQDPRTKYYFITLQKPHYGEF